MAEAFSYFNYNHNLERSFLSSLSQILQESNEHNDHDDHDDNDTFRRLQILEDDDGEKKVSNLTFNISDQDSVKSNKSSSDSNSNSNSNSSNSSQSSQSGDSHSDNEDEEPLLVQLTNLKSEKSTKQKHAKVVPLPVKKARQAKKKEAFFEVSEDEADDIKEVNIPDRGDTELETIVKQLVLLENEASKAQQFLEFIQKHNCFDKQDHKAVNRFLELIEEEKKSLIVVLSNYSSQMQPLITMMTIAERRLTLLDSTTLITPGSTLHASFLEKQQALQDVIEQAAAHVYGK